ncbi:MAG: acylphosphatase [Deltaproteobacteria bacterium]|nr:acylphosphatase [Deltaproteobacteria bacterium]
MAMKRVGLVVEGRVQGVYFRGSTEEVARRLGVRGWVRNRDDGAVELLAEGEPAALEALVEWCRRGPAGARVERVTEQWSELEGAGLEPGFRVRR